MGSKEGPEEFLDQVFRPRFLSGQDDTFPHFQLTLPDPNREISAYPTLQLRHTGPPAGTR
jgi:hypothetical protein